METGSADERPINLFNLAIGYGPLLRSTLLLIAMGLMLVVYILVFEFFSTNPFFMVILMMGWISCSFFVLIYAGHSYRQISREPPFGDTVRPRADTMGRLALLLATKWVRAHRQYARVYEVRMILIANDVQIGIFGVPPHEIERLRREQFLAHVESDPFRVEEL